MLTPWGYEVGELPDLITPEQFSDETGGRFDGDARVAPAIKAASAAIRNYCGWHVAPALACSVTVDGEPGDVWLPTCALVSVESATVDGAEVEVTAHTRRGRVRLARKTCGLGNVTIGFVAGFDAEALPDLVSIVADRVVDAISLTTYGVASESAGGVSVTYSASALARAASAKLPDDVKAALTPYRVVRSHAA